MLGVVLAGGDGTRFSRTGCCKPLLKINDRYLIEYTLDYLFAYGVREALIVVGKYDKNISDVLGDKSNGISLSYVRQTRPLGIVNALLTVAPFTKDQTVAMLLSDELFIDPCFSEVSKYSTADFLCGYTVPANLNSIRENYAINCAPDGSILSTEEKPKQIINEKKGTGFCVFSAECINILTSAYHSDGGAGRDLCDFMNLLLSKGKHGTAFQIAAEEININREQNLEYAKRRLKEETCT